MDISKIKQLIDLMEERTLAELTVQDGDKKVSISRHLPQANVQPVTATPYRDWETDRKSTRLNSSHSGESRMPSSA